MIAIEHSLKFVTEFDETNPEVAKLIAMPEAIQVAFLEEMLYSLMAKRIEPILAEINEGGSYAILKVVKP